MNDLRPQIRKALAGSSSSAPVDTKSLLRLGKADEVMAALELLLASREINTASITKGAFTTVQCWLTGAVGLVPAFSIRTPPFGHESVRLPPQVPQAAAKPPAAIVKPKTSIPTQPPKEKPMQQPSPVTVALVAIITEQPGITKKTLIELALKRAAGATEQQASKALLNLIHASKKVRVKTDVDGERAFFLNDGKAAEAKPAKAEKPAKAKKLKVAKLSNLHQIANSAEPVGAGHAREQKTSRARPAPASNGGDDDFSIMLAESGNVHVRIGGVTSVYTPQQAARLHRFIGRINQVTPA